MDKPDITGMIMKCNPVLIDKLADWAAKVLPRAVQRRQVQEGNKTA